MAKCDLRKCCRNNAAVEHLLHSMAGDDSAGRTRIAERHVRQILHSKSVVPMASFFQELAAEKFTSEALRHAQLERVESDLESLTRSSGQCLHGWETDRRSE